MSVHLGMRHDRLLRKQAVQMFERGCGYRLTARKLGVSAATVREWQKMYRVIGRGGLLAMGVKWARYDYETKDATAACPAKNLIMKDSTCLKPCMSAFTTPAAAMSSIG